MTANAERYTGKTVGSGGPFADSRYEIQITEDFLVYQVPGITTYVDVDVDFYANTLTFNSLVLELNAANFTQTKEFTTGPGQTTDITATVQVNPTTLTATTPFVVAITPGTGGQYNVENVIPDLNDIVLSGTYLLDSDSESKAGTFMLTQPIVINWPAFTTLETSAYPSELVLSNGGSISFDADEKTIATESVAGREIIVGLSNIDVIYPDEVPLTIPNGGGGPAPAVPTPTTFVAGVALLIGLLPNRCRKRPAKGK